MPDIRDVVRVLFREYPWGTVLTVGLISAVVVGAGFLIVYFALIGAASVWFVLSVLVGGAFAIYILGSGSLGLYSDIKAEDPPTLTGRIGRLQGELKRAARAVTMIEVEIRERSALVKKLQADAELAQKLSTMNRSEVEAVAQALRGELRGEGRRARRIEFAFHAFFFFLGIVVTLMLQLVFHLSG